MPKYRVYSHLCRQGYRLVRRNSPPAITKRCDDSIKVSSPKRAKIEVPGVDYQAEYIRVPDNPETFKSLFLPPAAEASDYDCIPNLLPGTGTIQINFLDLELLPESIRNRKTSYVVNKKDFKSMESHSNLNLDSPSTAMNTSSMEEISRDPSAMFTLTNNPLYDGETKPLLVGSHIGNTFKTFSGTMNTSNFFLFLFTQVTLVIILKSSTRQLMMWTSQMIAIFYFVTMFILLVNRIASLVRALLATFWQLRIGVRLFPACQVWYVFRQVVVRVQYR